VPAPLTSPSAPQPLPARATQHAPGTVRYGGWERRWAAPVQLTVAAPDLATGNLLAANLCDAVAALGLWCRDAVGRGLSPLAGSLVPCGGVFELHLANAIERACHLTPTLAPAPVPPSQRLAAPPPPLTETSLQQPRAPAALLRTQHPSQPRVSPTAAAPARPAHPPTATTTRPSPLALAAETVGAQALARALRRLPALLHYSVHPHDRRGWHVEVLPSLRLLHSPEGPRRPCHDHGVLVAASGAGSRVANMREHGMLEPLSAKVQLLQSVVATVAALLRVDRVIQVKGALRRRTKGPPDVGRGAAAETGAGDA
jgi:hypothetical protein